MAFAALVLNVHIYSISNKLKEFNVFSTAEFFKLLEIEKYVHENAETVYIYHHAYGRPFDPCLNHICVYVCLSRFEWLLATDEKRFANFYVCEFST